MGQGIGFIRSKGDDLSFDRPDGWQHFLRNAGQLPGPAAGGYDHRLGFEGIPFRPDTFNTSPSNFDLLDGVIFEQPSPHVLEGGFKGFNQLAIIDLMVIGYPNAAAGSRGYQRFDLPSFRSREPSHGKAKKLPELM